MHTISLYNFNIKHIHILIILDLLYFYVGVYKLPIVNIVE